MAEFAFARNAFRGAWASALAPISAPASGGRIGIGIELHKDVEIVSFLIGRGDASEIAARLDRGLGLTLQDMGRVGKFAALVVVGTAPGHWTVLRFGTNSRSLAALLTETAGREGFVVDQTGGRALVRVSGADVGRLLMKGCPIDLHPSVFAAGHAASTVIEHIPVQIWRSDEALAYDLMVARSYADDFVHWLTVAAADFGYAVSGNGDCVWPA